LRERLRQDAKEKPDGYLHRLLVHLDPAAAKNIHANDVPKLIRAIEVCMAARRPMSELWRRGRNPLTGFRVLLIGLNPDRKKLYERLNQRAARMFDTGLIEEALDIYKKYGERAPALNSTGYKQAVQFIHGEMSREQAQAAAQQAHRNYAKRQMTWFRRQADVKWFEGFGDEPKIQEQAIAFVSKSNSERSEGALR
jgi:tRNA dimethylallyltransferase